MQVPDPLIKRRKNDGKSVASQFQQVIDSLGDDVFVSFDIDSISGADAPVSLIVLDS